MKSLLFFVLMVPVLYGAGKDVTCKKKGKFSKTITIGSGDSYTFNTQAKKKYGGNVKCSVTYKRGSFCPKLSFSCSKFNINNKNSKCSWKTGDRMIIHEQGSKKSKSYCKKKSPDVSTTSKFLRVSFISNRKKHSTGAECRVQCESEATTPTSTGGSGFPSCPGCPFESQVTPLVKSLGKFAINHQNFPLLTPCKEEMVGEVVNASTQVVAGTNYFLTIKVTALSGENCKEVTRFICSNIIIFRHLPVNCAGSGNTCTQLVRPEEIRCTAATPPPSPSPSCLCPAIYSPVCAENGEIFSNDCSAKCQGYNIACQGECPCQ